jgi:hypothetical protein
MKKFSDADNCYQASLELGSNALSIFYPKESDERRRIDAMLLAAPRKATGSWFLAGNDVEFLGGIQ